MKLKLLTIFIFALTLASCSSNDDSSSKDEMEQEKPTTVTGNFVNSAHPTSGTVTTNDDLTELILTNFKSDDGPLLELYLATDLAVTNYVSLGLLKGLDGNYTYNLPENIDLNTYNHVIVWCVDFSVNFGYAVLE